MKGYILVRIMTKEKKQHLQNHDIGKPVRLATDSEENVKNKSHVKILLKPHHNPKLGKQGRQWSNLSHKG